MVGDKRECKSSLDNLDLKPDGPLEFGSVLIYHRVFRIMLPHPRVGNTKSEVLDELHRSSANSFTQLNSCPPARPGLAGRLSRVMGRRPVLLPPQDLGICTVAMVLSLSWQDYTLNTADTTFPFCLVCARCEICCQHQPAARTQQAWGHKESKSLLPSPCGHSQFSILYHSPHGMAMVGEEKLVRFNCRSTVGTGYTGKQQQNGIESEILARSQQRSCFHLLTETLTTVYDLPDFL